MSGIEFEGREVIVQGIGKKWIPLAQVRVINGKESVICKMLVDSGADITLLPRKTGEMLGFRFQEDEIREIRGIGDAAVPYVIRHADLEIGNVRFDCRIGISLIEEVPMVLGRLDVFDYFDVEFKQSQGITIFREVK